MVRPNEKLLRAAARRLAGVVGSHQPVLLEDLPGHQSGTKLKQLTSLGPGSEPQIPCGSRWMGFSTPEH